MKSRILKKESLNFEMTRFILEKPWDFQAGQYTMITFKDKSFYFSMASSPLADTLELQIQNSPIHALDPEFAEFLATASQFDVSPPAGKAILTPGKRPLLLIAGGSGIAPLKSIADTARIISPERSLQIYWGVRNRACFYDVGGLEYLPVLSEERVPGMRFGLVHEAVREDFADLSPFDIYLAGPFSMSYAAHAAFLQKGAPSSSLFSDAFEFI